MTREEIIRQIQTIAKRDGRAPGRERFASVTGISMHKWSGVYWARWGDALREAGFDGNSLQEAASESDLLSTYLGVVIELGHVPSDSELRLHGRNVEGFPGHTTFRNRLGQKQHLLRKLLAFALEQRVTPEIEEAIRSRIEAEQGDEQNSDGPDNGRVQGYVYMLKSGKRYKIGKTASPMRRLGQIGIELPDASEPVHTIETDDPSGIEAYWHNRFRDKRLNGEWFDLIRDDVRAFKRRKYM
jgi:hypothetical protein